MSALPLTADIGVICFRQAATDPKPPYTVITYIYTGEYSIVGFTAALEKDGVAVRRKG